jgi:hypothetical protein
MKSEDQILLTAGLVVSTLLIVMVVGVIWNEEFTAYPVRMPAVLSWMMASVILVTLGWLTRQRRN